MIRRAIGTTLAGLCALTGPLAGSAFSATAPTLSLTGLSWVGGARPGVPFSVTPASGCPADEGVQTVEISFTDRAGIRHSIGTAETDAAGAWSSTLVRLPVDGLDAEGNWSTAPVAAGAGSVGATCFAADESAEEGDGEETKDPDESGDEEVDPGEEPTDPGDETSDPDDEVVDPDADATDPDEDSVDVAAAGEAVPTQTYAGVALSVSGAAPKLALSAAMIKPGGSVTVTASEGCLGTGSSQVRVAVTALADGAADGEEPDDSPDPGAEGAQPAPSASGLPTAAVTTSATGSWGPVTLVLPARTLTGDYAVTADCTRNESTTSSYDAEPFALGTVLIQAPVCGARTVFTRLTGTYSGELAGSGDVSLPSKLALSGDGPWNVKARSGRTGRLLAARTLACDKPRFDVDGSKPGLSGSNKPRVKACNTGRAPVVAVLQVQVGKKYRKADKETLAPGTCAWLEGPKLDRGKKVKAQLLIDAPGKASDDVVTSFTVKRGKH
jgi:hypothetical protein